jgi:hypothetical protein
MSEQLQSSARTVRIPAELCDRIDAARGGVPRERFVRSLLEDALDAGAKLAAQMHPAPAQFAAPASSAQARGNVRPVPKGGKS